MEKLKMRILLLLLCCESIFANEFGSITGVIEDLESKESLIGTKFKLVIYQPWAR